MATKLKDYITEQSTNDIHMKDFFFKGVLTDDTTRLYVLDDSVLIPYDEELNKYKVPYTLKGDEYRKYRFNTWRVSEDI